MDKRFNYVFGTIFIITSGVLYTMERCIAYFSWVGAMNAHPTSYATHPTLPDLQTNIYIPIFIIIGICFFVSGYRKRKVCTKTVLHIDTLEGNTNHGS